MDSFVRDDSDLTILSSVIQEEVTGVGVRDDSDLTILSSYVPYYSWQVAVRDDSDLTILSSEQRYRREKQKLEMILI